MVKNPPANAGDVASTPESGRSPWRRKWQHMPVLLPGKSHGQRSLASYSPWGCKRIGHNLMTTITTTGKKDLLYNTGNSAQYAVIT